MGIEETINGKKNELPEIPEVTLVGADIEEIIREILERKISESKSKQNLIIYQYCSTLNSHVSRDNWNLNICGKDSCVSCSFFSEAITKTLKDKLI